MYCSICTFKNKSHYIGQMDGSSTSLMILRNCLEYYNKFSIYLYNKCVLAVINELLDISYLQER